MGREGSKGLEDLRSLGSRMRRVWGRKGMSGMKGREGWRCSERWSPLGKSDLSTMGTE